MRKVTETTVEAFINNTNKSCGNTTVQNVGGVDIEYRLHGNKIAIKNVMTGKVEISDCSWQSNTTRERLNGILRKYNGYIQQKNFVWYLTINGKTEVMESGKYYTIN